MKSYLGRSILALCVGAVVLNCSANERIELADLQNGDGQFTSPDADAVGIDSEAGLTSYCPSNACPTGRTTCATSQFRCDVDLRTDRMNCGTCGVACPIDTSSDSYACVDSRCVSSCGRGYLDCDGIADNGCEVVKRSNDNCGACGNKCPDPAKPCIDRGGDEVGCGCKGSDLYCGTRCVDAMTDDKNCASCGNFCDSTGGGAPQFQHMYYGCSGGTCGHLKCESGWANCDGDISNGCEVNLTSRENCGGCGNACDSGQDCRADTRRSGAPPECLCPSGLTFCPSQCTGGLCQGVCVDLTSDSKNCSSCRAACLFDSQGSGAGICTYGLCTFQCRKGRADCNGDTADFCETNTESDPANCGDCGRSCDIAAGQACVGGECVVQPCDRDQDAGEVAR
ncbi:MAG: hypothetical protein K0S65_3878 [Labilithrix sp.]|nr:hypothetical protein [Labilithrix sp.]